MFFPLNKILRTSYTANSIPLVLHKSKCMPIHSVEKKAEFILKNILLQWIFSVAV